MTREKRTEIAEAFARAQQDAWALHHDCQWLQLGAEHGDALNEATSEVDPAGYLAMVRRAATESYALVEKLAELTELTLAGDVEGTAVLQ